MKGDAEMSHWVHALGYVRDVRLLPGGMDEAFGEQRGFFTMHCPVPGGGSVLLFIVVPEERREKIARVIRRGDAVLVSGCFLPDKPPLIPQGSLFRPGAEYGDPIVRYTVLAHEVVPVWRGGNGRRKDEQSQTNAEYYYEAPKHPQRRLEMAVKEKTQPNPEELTQVEALGAAPPLPVSSNPSPTKQPPARKAAEKKARTKKAAAKQGAGKKKAAAKRGAGKKKAAAKSRKGVSKARKR